MHAGPDLMFETMHAQLCKFRGHIWHHSCTKAGKDVSLLLLIQISRMAWTFTVHTLLARFRCTSGPFDSQDSANALTLFRHMAI